MVCPRQMNSRRVAESGHIEEPRQVLLRHLVLPCLSFSVGLTTNFTIFLTSPPPTFNIPHTILPWTLVVILDETLAGWILVFNKTPGLHSHQVLRPPPHSIPSSKIIHSLNLGRQSRQKPSVARLQPSLLCLQSMGLFHQRGKGDRYSALYVLAIR
jgi:hypothetical protein